MDFVLSQGVGCVCVLDISAAALQRARERLGETARRVNWIEADVTGDWHVPFVDVWHDRGVFHFLTSAEDRARYLAHLRTALRPGGSAIIATFAPDGPEKCSGLHCVRVLAGFSATRVRPRIPVGRVGQREPSDAIRHCAAIRLSAVHADSLTPLLDPFESCARVELERLPRLGQLEDFLELVGPVDGVGFTGPPSARDVLDCFRGEHDAG